MSTVNGPLDHLYVDLKLVISQYIVPGQAARKPGNLVSTRTTGMKNKTERTKDDSLACNGTHIETLN